MKVLALAVCVLVPVAAIAQTPSSVTASPTSTRNADLRVAPNAPAIRTAVAPAIDGRLDDAAWLKAPVIDTFTQRDPAEGESGSERTEVRIVYDNEAVYVAARLHDRHPVTTRLGRRDMANASSDWFKVSFDSFHDRRS